MNLKFPYTIGFIYFEEYDEWRIQTLEGSLVLWENPNNKDTSRPWVLSYQDSEDYLHQITTGYSDDIIDGIKKINRDLKISEIIGE